MTLLRLAALAMLLSAAACTQTLPQFSDADAVIQDAVESGRIPGAVLVMLPGGHDLQRPEPAKGLARAVTSFLSADRAESASSSELFSA